MGTRRDKTIHNSEASMKKIAFFILISLSSSAFAGAMWTGNMEWIGAGRLLCQYETLSGARFWAEIHGHYCPAMY